MIVAYSTFVQGAMALLQLPLAHQFHWSRAQVMFALPLMSWPTALLMPLLGRYFDKVGARKVLIGTAIGISLGTFALAFTSSNIFYFYGCFIVLGLLGASVVGYYKIISATFSRHRGKAFAQVQGMFRAVQAVVTAPAPAIVAAIYVATGSYNGAYIMFVCGTALSITMFMLMPRYKYAAGR